MIVRRFWHTYLIVAAVLVLLTGFLGLQYNWLRQASLAERDRMQKRAEEDSRRFAEDFNREIQAAYFNFQADAAALEKGDAAEVAERFDYWKRNTEFPALIREVDYVSNTEGTRPRRFDPDSRRFVDANEDPSLAAMLEKVRGEKRPPSLLEKELTLLVPIRKSEKAVETVVIRRSQHSVGKPNVELSPPVGFIFVRLDEKVVKEVILPTITARYFQPTEFAVTVNDRNGEKAFGTTLGSGKPDVSAALFDLTPGSMMFFSNRDLLPRMPVANGASVILNQKIESRTLTSTSEQKPIETGESFTFELKEGDSPKRTAVVMSSGGGEPPWKLNIQHTAGSIDAFIDGERTKSFLIGLGIYFLLAGAILAIVVSATRSKTFAQRQVDFVSSVSHEFRTPLAVICTAGENLADGVAQDPSQVTRYGDLIKGEGRKLSGMVEQILEFAGARSGRKKYNLAPIEIAEVVNSAIAECLPQIDEVGIEVETDIAPRLPAVNGDAAALETALKNLIHNAIKYGNGSNLIRVVAENGNGSVRLSVEDRGIGIAKREHGRIFEPFYRSGEVVDAQIHGSGLGLSMVKEIAEAHGGTVGVWSEPGKGSKFTIELPKV